MIADVLPKHLGRGTDHSPSSSILLLNDPNEVQTEENPDFVFGLHFLEVG